MPRPRGAPRRQSDRDRRSRRTALRLSLPHSFGSASSLRPMWYLSLCPTTCRGCSSDPRHLKAKLDGDHNRAAGHEVAPGAANTLPRDGNAVVGRTSSPSAAASAAAGSAAAATAAGLQGGGGSAAAATATRGVLQTMYGGGHRRTAGSLSWRVPIPQTLFQLPLPSVAYSSTVATSSRAAAGPARWFRFELGGLRPRPAAAPLVSGGRSQFAGHPVVPRLRSRGGVAVRLARSSPCRVLHRPVAVPPPSGPSPRGVVITRSTPAAAAAAGGWRRARRQGSAAAATAAAASAAARSAAARSARHARRCGGADGGANGQ